MVVDEVLGHKLLEPCQVTQRLLIVTPYQLFVSLEHACVPVFPRPCGPHPTVQYSSTDVHYCAQPCGAREVPASIVTV